MKWFQDEFGEYTMYKNFPISKYNNSKLNKYVVLVEEFDDIKLTISVSSIEKFKEIINDKIKQYELDKKNI